MFWLRVEEAPTLAVLGRRIKTEAQSGADSHH